MAEDIKEETKKKNSVRQVMCMLIPLHGNSSKLVRRNKSTRLQSPRDLLLLHVIFLYGMDEISCEVQTDS